MNQLIITFEFLPGNNDKIIAFKNMIRSYGQFAFITQNSCIIWTDKTVVNVRDYLLTGITFNDKLFVAKISAPGAWTTSIGTEVSEYIIKNLK